MLQPMQATFAPPGVTNGAKHRPYIVPVNQYRKVTQKPPYLQPPCNLQPEMAL